MILQLIQKRGSHKIARHPCLINQPGYGPRGTITIPTIHGKHVKKVYVKNVLKAIKIVSEDHLP